MTRTRSPFPGMDPYLENPAVWPGFHDRLITYLCDDLQVALPKPYYADIQDRVYLEEAERWIVPDVRISRQVEPAPARAAERSEGPAAVLIEDASIEVREPLIEIRDTRTGHRVVTVIEVLSPANKRPDTEGSRLYREKQREILRGEVNLIEIDLLRGGEHVVAVRQAQLEAHRPYDYLVVVRRAARPSRREVYPIPLRSRLPRVAVPLREPDPDVSVEIEDLVERAYERGAYGKRIDYARPAEPPLGAEDAGWASERVSRG